MRSATADLLTTMGEAATTVIGGAIGSELRFRLLSRAYAVLEGQWDATPELALTWRVPPELLRIIGITPPAQSRPDLRLVTGRDGQRRRATSRAR
jgi:hypothetical protein